MTDLEKVEYLKYAMQACATNDEFPTDEYEKYRKEIISKPLYKKYLPKELLTCRKLGEFWTIIKSMFPHYQQRREYIKKIYEDLILFVENNELIGADEQLQDAINVFGSDYIIDCWNKAIERRKTDPKGAITSSRTLLETTCKYILDNLNEKYNDNSDLPVLYNLVASKLKLSPKEQTDPIMKQITGGCFSMIQGIGSIRNKISDAHGEGVNTIKVDEMYSFLIVNLAGNLSLFLLQNYEKEKCI